MKLTILLMSSLLHDFIKAKISISGLIQGYQIEMLLHPEISGFLDAKPGDFEFCIICGMSALKAEK
jgi:hypothetical protein